MTITDRTAEPDDVFAARLAVIEAQPAVDIAGDLAEEAVARALFGAAHPSEDWLTGYPEDMRNYFRRLARAALAAMPPVDAALRDVLAPGDPGARMDAYYYGFERTGIGIVDDILSEVARAGKSFHSTDMWSETDDKFFPASHADLIQQAANAAADRLRAALDGLS